MLIRTLCLLAFLSVCFLATSQDDPGTGTVTVFSEDGTKFTLYLNGDRKNASADTRVVAANISEVPVSFRIVFEDSKIPEIKKNGMRQGTHCLYAVVKNKKGEYVLKVGGCSESAPEGVASPAEPAQPSAPAAPAPVSAPDQLLATYANGVISINDGRTLKVTQVKVNGMTYPRIHFTAVQGATVSLKYDNGNEQYSAESPMEYEIKDFSNNNAYVTVTVDEGGPARTWHVKLKNSNGYDLKIE
jgi:hypothetical protein